MFAKIGRNLDLFIYLSNFFCFSIIFKNHHLELFAMVAEVAEEYEILIIIIFCLKHDAAVIFGGHMYFGLGGHMWGSP